LKRVRIMIIIGAHARSLNLTAEDTVPDPSYCTADRFDVSTGVNVAIARGTLSAGLAGPLFRYKRTFAGSAKGTFQRTEAGMDNLHSYISCLLKRNLTNAKKGRMFICCTAAVGNLRSGESNQSMRAGE